MNLQLQRETVFHSAVAPGVAVTFHSLSVSKRSQIELDLAEVRASWRALELEKGEAFAALAELREPRIMAIMAGLNPDDLAERIAEIRSKGVDEHQALADAMREVATEIDGRSAHPGDVPLLQKLTTIMGKISATEGLIRDGWLRRSVKSVSGVTVDGKAATIAEFLDFIPPDLHAEVGNALMQAVYSSTAAQKN